jgi:hypothetical protein
MTPSRILPDLQCSLLCEDVRQEANGNFIILGVISFIRVPQLPVTAFKLCLFNRWVAGCGQFVETVRLIAPDETTVMRKNEVRFALQDVIHNVATITLWSPITFETPGVYYIEILVDDVMKLRFPIALILAPPPEQRPEGGPKKAA